MVIEYSRPQTGPNAHMVKAPWKTSYLIIGINALMMTTPHAPRYPGTITQGLRYRLNVQYRTFLCTCFNPLLNMG